MQDAARRALAEVYDAWRLTCDVTVADVVRASGLVRHTVENVRDGGRRRPTQETLRQVAVGIVQGSPYAGRYDISTVNDCYRELSLAAGYGDPSASDARSWLAMALWYHFRHPARSDAWNALIDQCGDLSPEQTQAWRVFIRRFKRLSPAQVLAAQRAVERLALPERDA